MRDNNQLEMIDLRRDRARPAGGGRVVDGLFIYHALAQRVDQVAYTISSTAELLYKEIPEGIFPNAIDISSTKSKRPCYRIPREDVLDYIARRKVGAQS